MRTEDEAAIFRAFLGGGNDASGSRTLDLIAVSAFPLVGKMKVAMFAAECQDACQVRVVGDASTRVQPKVFQAGLTLACRFQPHIAASTTWKRTGLKFIEQCKYR